MAKRKSERSPCKESAADRIKQSTKMLSELNLLIVEIKKLLFSVTGIVGYFSAMQLPELIKLFFS